MKDLSADPLNTALAWCAEGRPVALATVVQTWGSAPQPVGSRLVIDGEQKFEGSVSGGCVEGAVIVEADDVLESGQPKLLTFGVSDETALDAGLACGGTIQIFLERLGTEKDDANRAAYEALAADRAARRPVILTTELSGGAHQRVHAGEEDAQGRLAAAMKAAFAAGESEILASPGGDIFLEVNNPQLRLVIIGAVHIAQHLAPMADAAGYEVVIVDPRRAFATPERFPGARLVAEWPDDVLPELGLDNRTAMAFLTHDPKIDDVALKLALDSDCFYIGALGSTRTHAKRCDRLKEAGFTEPQIDRIHAPIGLDIGAKGPAEIAISVVAQLVSVTRRHP